MGEADHSTLEMAEAIIAAHKAATRCDDTAGLALIEPLLVHAWQRLAVEYGPLPNRENLRERFKSMRACTGLKPAAS